MISESDLIAACELYGADSATTAGLVQLAREAARRGWWTAYADVFTGSYMALEAEATVIRKWEPLAVPGLLHSEDYAREVIRARHPNLTEGELSRRVDARMQRKTRLLGTSAPMFHAIIDEAVVRRRVGSREAMDRQLADLLRASERANITIQVLPFGAGAHPGMEGPFSVLSFEPGDPDVGYVESSAGEVYVEADVQVGQLRLLFERLSEAAMSPEESAELCELYGVERDQLRQGVTGPGHDVEGDDPMRRRALLTTAATIPVGLVVAFDDALDVPPEPERPEDLPQIRRRLAEARRLWDASALTTLMATLPGTLAAAREAAERIDVPAAWALAAAVHDVATDTLNKIGHKRSARITADRSVLLSARSGSPVAMGASARALGMMLRTTGRYPQALRVVDGAASRLESAGLRTPAQAGMYVRLLCTSAYTLAGAGDRVRAFERLAEAERAARRLPPQQAEVALPFVLLYRVNLNHVLGDPGAGLHVGRRLKEEMYPTPERKARLWTDIARVAWPTGDVEQAAEALIKAHAYAPAEVRDRPSIRAIADELVQRHPRVPGARELATAIGHPL